MAVSNQSLASAGSMAQMTPIALTMYMKLPLRFYPHPRVFTTRLLRLVLMTSFTRRHVFHQQSRCRIDSREPQINMAETHSSALPGTSNKVTCDAIILDCCADFVGGANPRDLTAHALRPVHRLTSQGPRLHRYGCISLRQRGSTSVTVLMRSHHCRLTIAVALHHMDASQMIRKDTGLCQTVVARA